MPKPLEAFKSSIYKSLLFILILVGTCFFILQQRKQERSSAATSRYPAGELAIGSTDHLAAPQEGAARHAQTPDVNEQVPFADDPRDEAYSVLTSIEQCLALFEPSAPTGALACLLSLNLDELDAQTFGSWVCDTTLSFEALSLVMNVRVSKLSPSEVFPYVQGIQDQCAKYSESNLTVGAIAFGRRLSEHWYRELMKSVDPGMLLPENGSDAVIQLADYFVRQGEPEAVRLLQDIGRGSLGGSDSQVHRAALISVVNLPSASDKFDYLCGIIGPGTYDNHHIGKLLAHFLTNGTCYFNGDPQPALTILLDLLHDPGYAKYCASQLKEIVDHGPPAGDNGLWQMVLDQAEAVRSLGTQ